MGYVENLRTIIGHRRIILNGSNVVIRNVKNRILMQQRTFPHGKWGLPGGIMELGESTEETARREVFEETGLIINSLSLIGVYSGSEYLCIAENGDEYYVVITAYSTDDYTGELSINSESISLKWVDFDKIPENTAKSHKKIISDYTKNHRNK